jgi:hypothetical protein
MSIHHLDALPKRAMHMVHLDITASIHDMVISMKRHAVPRIESGLAMAGVIPSIILQNVDGMVAIAVGRVVTLSLRIMNVAGMLSHLIVRIQILYIGRIIFHKAEMERRK